jgi:hypothetical protein
MADEDPEICPETNGKHQLSRDTIEICKEIPPPEGEEKTTLLVDVWCSLCGCSGATRITMDQVNW